MSTSSGAPSGTPSRGSSTAASPATTAANGRTPKQQFLDAYEREHETTMRVLRSYPADRTDLRPHPRCKTALELAWVFVLERQLGTMLYNDAFASGPPDGESPPPPESWDEILDSIEIAHRDFADLIRSAADDDLGKTVTFFTAPKTMGHVPRMDLLWFLLHDEIHHRGQFSVYLRMADGKVPSIYGPSADEPWM
ncbi:MAG: DinB family protein [Gemmatimonadota bacterium]